MSTQLKLLDEDYWGKLKHYMKHMKETSGMNLALQVDILNVIKWYVYVYFDTNHDCCGHIGSMVNLANETIYIYSRKHKMNVNRSNSIELIDFNDNFVCIFGNFCSLWVKVIP